MMMAICVRKKKCSIDKYEIFGIIMSFGCSAAETEMTSYNLRPISKAVFFVIFVPCLLFLSYTTAFMPNVGFGEITNATTLAFLNTTHCLNLCDKDESTKNYCGSLWRYFEDETSIDLNQMSPHTDSNIGLTFPQTHGVILIVLSSLFVLSVIEGLLESWIPYSPYQLLYKTTEDLSFDDKKIKNLTENLARQKKSSVQKIKEVQTNFLKNTILTVTLKNDALKVHNTFQGTYKISEMSNGKPSWIFHEKKKAIWYDIKNTNWSIGPLENLGTTTKSFVSIGNGDLGPHNVPSSKWKYYIPKEKKWEKVVDGDVIIKNKNLTENLASQKKSSEQKIKDVQTHFLKNTILTVTLKNDALKVQNTFQGTYEISEMSNGKPSWIFHEKKKAIWYDIKYTNWCIGNLKNLGTTTKAFVSIGNGDLDPHNVPSSKWKYYVSKEKKWEEVVDGDVIIKNGGRDEFICFINEKTAKEVGKNDVVIEGKGKNVYQFMTHIIKKLILNLQQLSDGSLQLNIFLKLVND